MSETNSFKLIIEDDEGRRSVVPVDLGEVSIGRLEGNTIRLNERNVSRRHARLFKETHNVVAEDLDSYNGVFVNGDRIKGRQQLLDGDLVKIGDFQLELRGEGLQRRTEETTQRTLMPGMESTQPEIRVNGSSASEGTQPHVPMPQARAPEPEPQPRHEPTAIIRMDHLEEVEEARKANRALAGQKPKIICVSTQFAGREFEVSKTEVVVGRTDENDIAIDHRSVSRHHAKILTSGNTYKVIDMKSANGTLVNGEEYAQADLKSGDLLELGHVKFRFVPPGENYTFTAEEAAVIQQKSTARGTDSGMQPAVAAAVEGGSPGLVDMLRANPLVVMAIGGLVVIILLMLVWMVASGDETPPEVSTVTPQETGAAGAAAVAPTGAQPAAGGSDVDSMLQRANVELGARQWTKAGDIARGVLALSPGNPQAESIVAKADAEAGAQKKYDAAVAAIGESRWTEAWDSLKEVDSASSYATQAAGLQDQVRAALITELISEAEAATGDGEWDTALAAADRIAELDAERPEVERIRGDVESGKARAATRRPTKTAKPPKPPRTKTKTTPPPAPAASGPSAKDAYKAGVAELQSGQYNKAITHFNACLRADNRYPLCHRALGITYAKAGNGPKAYRYYKQYLKISPNAKDAPQVRQFLEQYERSQ